MTVLVTLKCFLEKKKRTHKWLKLSVHSLEPVCATGFVKRKAIFFSETTRFSSPMKIADAMMMDG